VTDIQQARDVLAKWRKGTHEGPWARSMPTIRDANGRLVVSDPLTADARLIVGTAGNPDLLDTLDNFLWKAYRDFAYTGKLTECDEPGAVQYAERIAAAIVAADKRMTS
jgi:hypothetical protein